MKVIFFNYFSSFREVLVSSDIAVPALDFHGD